jgi:hypothetical protein
MRTTLLFILLFFFNFQFLNAQNNSAELVRNINATVEGSYNPFNFYEKTGSIEQTQDGIMQRFKLAEVGNIKVTKNTEGYSVDISCKDQNGCITLIKNSTQVTQMNVASFFFGNEMNSNAFASNLTKLVANYKNSENKPNATATKKQDIITTQEPIKNEVKEVKTAPVVEQKTDGIIHVPKTNTKKEIVEEEEEIEDGEKPNAKSKTTKKNIEKEESEEKVVSKASKDFCSQINQLLKIANDKNFKSIEGNETNATKKINDSKFKLKGAKKNYLNWYNNERTFIAEIKTSLSYEDLMIDYDNIQAEIEACLGSSWDSDDRSGEKEYDNFNGEVRDTEYTDIDKKMKARLRIILLSDEDNKSTLFIRIQ